MDPHLAAGVSSRRCALRAGPSPGSAVRAVASAGAVHGVSSRAVHAAAPRPPSPIPPPSARAPSAPPAALPSAPPTAGGKQFALSCWLLVAAGG